MAPIDQPPDTASPTAPELPAAQPRHRSPRVMPTSTTWRDAADLDSAPSRLTVVSDVAMRPLRALVEANRAEIKAIVSRHRGRSVAIFGSVARGDETPESDIDLLVEFEPGASLLDLARIKLDIEDFIGRTVDVVSLGSLLVGDDDVRRDAVTL